MSNKIFAIKLLDGWKMLQEEIDTFNPTDYPLKCNRKEKEMSCSVFGHMCTVFLVGEPFTETPEFRKEL
jgi:hypothetical protein